MNARVAKKVRRARRLWHYSDYRLSTYRRAVAKSLNMWARSARRTEGHRWGRWDHTFPSPPWECPF